MQINADRLQQRLAQFAAIGALSRGGVNRQALTKGDRQARRLLHGLAVARGFTVFQDAAANLFVRREGLHPDLPPLLIGSHLDSQPAGGRFDGALGTLSAFEVLESLGDADIATERPVEVVAWMNEEGCRFAPGCMGSMAFAAGAIPADWDGKRGADGAELSTELQATLDALPEAKLRPLGFPISGYVEVHIEQGPSLEAEEIPIGAIIGIQGTRWLEVTLTGQTTHAGTTAQSYRKGPLRALTAALHSLYETVMPEDVNARFTIGRIAIEPGSINASPEIARCTIDMRHPDASALDAIERTVLDTLSSSASSKGCTISSRQLFDMPPGTFDSGIVETIEAAAQALGLTSKRRLNST